MNRLLTLFVISGISFLLVECSTGKKTTSATPTIPSTDNPVVGEIKRNFTPAQMEEGKTIWEGKCARCHKLYSPGSYTVHKWESILVRMNPKAKLNQDEAGKVRAYILTNAKS